MIDIDIPLKAMLRLVRSALFFVVRLFLVCCFWVTTHLLFDVRVEGALAGLPNRATYYALQHKRDSDPFFVLPALMVHDRFAGNLLFGLRADAFYAGFLARLVPTTPWLARPLYPLNVGPILRTLGARPLFAIQQSPTELWLRLVMARDGDRQVEDVLTPDFIARLAHDSHVSAAQFAKSPLSYLLSWRFQPFLQTYQGPEIMLPAYQHTLRHEAITLLLAQLADLTRRLGEGASLLGAPEGQLSPDGRVGAVSAGFMRILQRGAQPLAIIPISVVYDTMARGRMKVFVSIASAIAFDPGSDAHTVAEQIQLQWRRQSTFTGSHLAACLLHHAAAKGIVAISTAELADNIGRLALELQALGHSVDRALFHKTGRWHNAQDFLEVARQHGYVCPTAQHHWEITQVGEDLQVARGGVGYPEFPLAYTWNEARDMLLARPAPTGPTSALVRWLYESAGVVCAGPAR